MSTDLTKRLEKLVDIYCKGNKSKFADLINMTPQTFNNYIQGNRRIGWDVMKRFAALGVNLNWLVIGLPPIKTSDLNDSGVTRIDFVNEMDEDDEAGKYKGTKNGTDTANPGNDYFSHINQSDLSETEKNLLEEVKHFSDFLQKTVLPLQVKRLMLELMIEHIDQEIERLRGDRS